MKVNITTSELSPRKLKILEEVLEKTNFLETLVREITRDEQEQSDHSLFLQRHLENLRKEKPNDPWIGMDWEGLD